MIESKNKELINLLVGQIDPVVTYVSFPNIIDPRTNAPLEMKFRVPSCVELVDIIGDTRSDLKAAARITAKCLLDIPLDLTEFHDACAQNPGNFNYAEPEEVAARIFKKEGLQHILDHMLRAASFTLTVGKTPDDEVIERSKNSSETETPMQS